MKRSDLILLAVAAVLAAPLAGPPAAADAAVIGSLTGGRVARPGRPGGRERFHVLADGRVLAMVELARPPAAKAWNRALGQLSAAEPGQARAAAAAAARDQLAAVDRDQRALLPLLAAPDVDATVLYRVGRAYDGIAIEVDPARLDIMRGFPGVRAVHPLPVVALDNFSSVPLIGAPEVWDTAGPDARGDGVTIGIIDTGIDYVHRDFGGSGNYAGLLPDDNVVPWTTKVVGGWDFAGDQYDADGSSSAQTTPHPDPDPMDCYGHGTHVAGTAAGYGVTAAGDTYAGPWGPGTPFATLRVGPGVAPGARLYALKVFGCSGTTALTIEAIDWTLDPNQDGDLSDHLDVINMSLGSPYGQPDDPLVVAVDNAASLGVIVACSAGNSGDSSFIVGSPAAAARAIAAAASVDSTSVFDGFVVHSPAAVAGTYPCLQAEFGPRLKTTGDVGGSLAYPSADRDACAAFGSAQAAQIAGKVALVDRGTCTFETKVNNCQNAGALGVVVANNVPGDPFVMADDPTLNAVITIPAVLTSLAAGQALEAATLTQAVAVTLTASLAGRVRIVDQTRVDTLSSFTSRGPRLDDALVKPDLAAPGDTILSAALRTGSDGISLSGTSMAAPHVAGAAALLRELHPGWTVEEIKAALVDTARHDLFVGPGQLGTRFSPARVGAGRIDLAAAASTEVIAFDDGGDGRVGVTFGAPEVIGHLSLDRTIRIVNHASQARAFTLGVDPVTSVPGVAVSFPDGAEVVLPAQGSARARVRLEADAALLKHVLDASETPTQHGLARAWLAEESGFVTLTPDPPPTSGSGWDGSLRLPFWAAPRPASVMTAATAQVVVGSSGSGAIALTGRGVDTGPSPPVDVRSLAMPFELQIVDPDEPITTGSYDRFDIAYVGVASDARARLAHGGSLGDAVVEFAIVTRANWSTPNDAAFRVEIDTNGDGVADYVLTSSSFGDVLGADSNDAFVSLLCPAKGNGDCSWMPLGAFSPRDVDIAPFGTRVIVLPVLASALGLAPGASRFGYVVRAGPGGVLDATATGSFDPAAPGLWFGDQAFPCAFADQEGTTIPVGLDPASYQQDGGLGVLLLHLHNTSAQRAEVIAVATTGCAPSCAASVPSTAAAGTPVAMVGTVVPGGCGGAAAIDWDFGDGSPHGDSATATHVFAGPGSYAWRFTATVGGATCRRTGVIEIDGAPPFEAVVGGVAHNPGARGSTWRTALAIVNRSDVPATVTVDFRGVDRSQTATLTLAGGAAASFPDVLEQLFGVGAEESTQGALSLRADASLAVSARTYSRSPAGTVGQDMPALTSGPLVAGQTGVIPGLASNAGFRSNVGIVNVGYGSCSVAVRLFDGAGAALGSAFTLAAEAGGWAQRNDVLAAAGIAGADVAYATVTAASPGCSAWAYGSVVDNGTGDPTTLPAEPWPGQVGAAGTWAASVPAVARSHGLSGSLWRTSLALVNPGQAPVAATLRYRSTGGATATHDVALAPGAAAASSDVIADLFGLGAAGDTEGRVEITADAPLVVAARTYDLEAEGTLGQSMPALTPSDGAPAGAVGVLPGLSRNAGFRTNLGLVNLGGGDADVRVVLHGADGGALGPALGYHLAGGEWLQVTDVFAAAGLAVVEVGYATIETLTAGGAVWSYASIVDNGTGDPTTVPLQR